MMILHMKVLVSNYDLERHWFTLVDSWYTRHDWCEKRNDLRKSFALHILGESNPLAIVLGSFCRLHVLLSNTVEGSFQGGVSTVLARPYTN